MKIVVDQPVVTGYTETILHSIYSWNRPGGWGHYNTARILNRRLLHNAFLKQLFQAGCMHQQSLFSHSIRNEIRTVSRINWSNSCPGARTMYGRL